MRMCVLKATNLSKIFLKKRSLFSKKEKICAVDNLNIEVRQGESVAFLGPIQIFHYRLFALGAGLSIPLFQSIVEQFIGG